MCGRFILTAPLSAVERHFAVAGPIPNFPPRYNIAPSQPIPVLRRPSGAAQGVDQVEIVLMRWGLIPSWSRGPDARYSMINARAESLQERPAYRQAYRQRRALVPATGYYEWQSRTDSKAKDPWLISLPDRSLFFFAAVWEKWRNSAGKEVLSVAIVTVDASADLRPIHDRMPAALDGVGGNLWLSPAAPAELTRLVTPPAVSPFQAVRVGRLVNDPTHDAPDCIAELAAGR